MIKKEDGLIALITVLIISFVALFVVVSGNLLNIGQAQIVLNKEKIADSLYLATACAEHALLQLKNNFDNTSGGNLTIEGGNCTFTIETNGSSRVIKSQSIVENKFRKIKIVVRKPISDLTIDSWQEVADF